MEKLVKEENVDDNEGMADALVWIALLGAFALFRAVVFGLYQ
jgi:hypothetical protein